MKTSARRDAEPLAAAPLASKPPSVEGSFIRSQDGTKMARRGISRRGAQQTPAVKPGSEPVVAWSGPRDAPIPTPRVAALPEPPTIPSDGPAAPLHAAAAPTTVALAPPVVLEPPIADRLAEPANSVPTEPTALIASRTPATEVPAALLEAPAAAESLVTIRKLINQAKSNLDSIKSYRTRMLRQERVGDTLLPAEEVVLNLRREPLGVRLEWPTGPSKGREVLFAPNETEGKMQIYAPNSIVPRLSLPPDSPLVTKNSRHPISSAGFDSILRNVDASLHAAEAGRPDAGRFVYEGVQDVAEVGRPCHRIIETKANGEVWLVCLDESSLTPAMVHATDAQGQVLETYVFRDLTTDLPELATAEAFSADARWNQNKRGGVLGRLARGVGEAASGRAANSEESSENSVR